MSYDVFERVFDVVVVGDSFSALAAARKSAAGGLSTLLVMRKLSPGREVSQALINELQESSSETGDKFIAALKKRSCWRDGKLCCVGAEFAAVEILQTAGVEMLMCSTAVSPIVVDGRACGVIVAGKSSVQKVLGRVIVDATDDLVLADNAGALSSAAEYKSIGAFIMDRAGEGFEPQALTSDDGTEFFVRPGLWANQAIVSYKPADESPAYYQRHIPSVLKKIRSDISALKTAGVTAVGNELSRTGSAAAADIAKLPAAMVAVDIGKYTLERIIAAGDAAGEQAVELAKDTDKFGRLPEISPELLSASSIISSDEDAKTYDILVAGGGTAGSLAGIAAAREGMKTVLLESSSYLGGITTGGGIHMYYHGKAGGIQDEMDKRTTEYDKLFAGEIDARGYNPFARRVALLDMAYDSGVELVFDATVVAVDVKDAATDALAAGSDVQRVVEPESVTVVADGLASKYSARVYIDCTGDADLAVMSNAHFNVGRVGDGCAHAYTQSAGVMGVRDDKPSIWATNFDSGYVDTDDVTDLTRARLLGLIPLDYENWSDDDRWTYIASHLGVRQYRQIVGDYQITLADQISGRRFDDCIGYAASHYDNHAVDMENESDASVMWVWMMGQWRTLFGCEIPYRSLLPVGVENVIVACRALSLSQDAHHQLRMQRDMQRLGEAAALAASVAIETDKTPRNIDYKLLREKLESHGCLNDEHRPSGAVDNLDISELESLLGTDQADNSLWPLMVGSDSDQQNALPVLKKALEGDSSISRFHAASMLAALDDASGADELIEAVKQLRENPKEANTIGPLWKVAAIMLGRIGSEKATGAIESLLSRKDAKIGELVMAVRALGRIASKDSAQAILDVLKRDDVENCVPFRHWGGSKNQPLDDSRWRLDLTAAEALKNMGNEEYSSIAHDYLKDDRAYVRRRARAILEIN